MVGSNPTTEAWAFSAAQTDQVFTEGQPKESASPRNPGLPKNKFIPSGAYRFSLLFRGRTVGEGPVEVERSLLLKV